jgi:uncharacterized protein (UPF0335 family)
MTTIGDNVREQLKAYVERVERIRVEQKELSTDVADIYREAKGTGFDVKALKTVIRLRGQDASTRAEQDALVETYMHALGMI